MLNEFVYCPRLAYLEWVQKEWAESADTVEGSHVHRRADRASGELPSPEEVIDGAVRQVSALSLSSDSIGVTAKLDVLETSDGGVVPVDYKRGKRPHTARKAWDPERVQLCAQGMLLEDAGYRCTSGVLYFVASRERVRVDFDDELRAMTRNAIDRLRTVTGIGEIPPPLEDSPKCPRCSLVGICLPDETRYLQTGSGGVRPLAVAQTRSLPLYVQAHGAKVSKRGEQLIVSVDDEEVSRVRTAEVSQLVSMGNVYITTPTLHELMQRDIPIAWHSYGGWFFGHSHGNGHGNVELRTAQYRASFDEHRCIATARGWIDAKIRNCRVLLRRNARKGSDVSSVIKSLNRFAEQARRCRAIETLLGVEGAAAAAYFSAFDQMLKQSQKRAGAFKFRNRNRRPPTDPVNAMLSFGYALLTRTLTTTLASVGFDPFRGFLHQPRFGRPALALDMMEPFRPLLVDSVVVRAINNGEISDKHFVVTEVGTNLTDAGRKAFIRAFEQRMDQEVTHPSFGYKIEYRRLLEVQTRLLARHLLGEIPSNPNFVTR